MATISHQKHIRKLKLFSRGAGGSTAPVSLLAQGRSGEERDHLACRRARREIERMLQQRRLEHERFQALLRADLNAPDGLLGDELPVRLNPIRAWTRLETPALLDGAAPPAQVVVFATEREVAAAALGLEGQALLNELADYQPCTIGQWAALSRLAGRQQLADLCRDLRAMGLAAFG